MADPIIIEYAMARLLSTGHAGSDHASGWVKLENPSLPLASLALAVPTVDGDWSPTNVSEKLRMERVSLKFSEKSISALPGDLIELLDGLGGMRS